MKVIILFLFFLSINIFACKCDEPTIKSSFKSADFVVIGDVYDVNKTYKTGYLDVENSLSKIKIEKIYKSLGNDFKSKEITFFGQQFNSCDIIFNEKGKYLIFAYVDPDTTFFYSSLCLATKKLSELKESDFALLEKLDKDFTESLLIESSEDQTFSLELRTPDKLINELKFENQKLSENNQEQKIYFVAGVILLLLTIMAFIINRRNNCR